jgi:N-acetylmuramoyl-L-alanine amidase
MVLTGPDVPGAVSASLMPGVIAEPLVMANDDDAAFLATHEGRAAIVTAYERAILQFFQEPAT